MGSRMARRLLDAGHSVRVWNRTRAKAEPLEHAGASVAASPRDASHSARVAITMLADDGAVRAVVGGDDGLARGVGPETTVVDMSTVGPATIEWLRDALPAGTALLDAPVLGSLSEAEAGTLKIFAGGDAGVLDRRRDVLSVMGDVLHVGELGMGKAAKLVANSTLFGSIGVLAEAIALADGLGVARDVTFEVLSSTPIAAQAERRRDAIGSGDFPLRFALSLARKDAGLVDDAAAGAGVDVRIARAALEWLVEAEESGLGGSDYSALIAHITQRAGQPRA
jgi:3-hydroxyisobutyrate dehydrogenase/2-hydroxy-3-oxopropionate reductase